MCFIGIVSNENIESVINVLVNIYDFFSFYVKFSLITTYNEIFNGFVFSFNIKLSNRTCFACRWSFLFTLYITLPIIMVRRKIRIYICMKSDALEKSSATFYFARGHLFEQKKQQCWVIHRLPPSLNYGNLIWLES